MPRFDIEVQLTGTDGSTPALMAKVTRALRKVATPEEIKEFQIEALSGDYNHFLSTCMKWVEVS